MQEGKNMGIMITLKKPTAESPGGGGYPISARIRLGFLDNTSLCSNWWLRLLAFIPAIEYGDRLGRQLL